jgi:hypothetical protein
MLKRGKQKHVDPQAMMTLQTWSAGAPYSNCQLSSTLHCQSNKLARTVQNFDDLRMFRAGRLTIVRALQLRPSLQPDPTPWTMLNVGMQRLVVTRFGTSHVKRVNMFVTVSVDGINIR